MPFPIIPGVVVLVASSLMGLYKTCRGTLDIKKAKRIGESAENRHGIAVKSLDSKRQETLEKAANYGRLIEECRTTTVRQLAEFLVALQKRPGMRGIPIPDDVEVSAATLEEYRAKILDAPNDLLAAASAVGAGSAAGASALGLVGLFGTASTGTAIGGLSGAAASNAVLAWLGGGSLASGGLGMAGGAVVLGGIAVAPVLLVTGFVLASKGEKILTQARAYEAKADSEVARIDELTDVLGQIQVRTDEMNGVLEALNRHARSALGKLDVPTFSKNSPKDMKNLTVVLQMVTAMAEVMRTPILTDGEVSEQSGQIVVKYRKVLEN